MDYNTLQEVIYNWNEDELFYKAYFEAKHNSSIDDFIESLDLNDILRRHLLIPEIKETIPSSFEDSYFFKDETNDLITSRHNRYCPPLEHSHSFFEVLYVYEGSCIQDIDNQTVKLKSGDVCIIPPGTKHSISVFDESIILNCIIRKATLHNVFFNFLNNSNILSAFFLNNIYTDKGNNYLLFHTGNDFEIRRGFLYTYWESINKDLYFDQMIGYTIMLIFGLLIRLYNDSVEVPVFSKKDEQLRYEILRFIQDNYSTITLDEIAEHFHFTPVYTSKLIKSLTGKTYTELLRQVRLEKAQILLIDSNLSVNDISAYIGYENPEHFIRLYKREFGITPSSYRKLKIKPN